MNISYREAKRILAKQEEAREVINSYRGMETLQASSVEEQQRINS